MKSASPPIRMVFEMSREDHPRLYEDLIRFPKGTKRINRLRTLAHDGLLVQISCDGAAGQRVLVGTEGAVPCEITNQIFEEPLSQ